MNSKKAQTAPAKRSGAVAQNVAVLLIFLLPILFIPTSWMPFAHSKMLLLLLVAFVPIALWVRERLKEREFIYPHSYVLWFMLLLPLVYLVSAILSSDISNSLVGFGQENDTFVFILLLSAVFLVGAIVFASVASVAKAVLAITLAFSIVAFIQIIRLLFGAENILPSIFSPNVTTTLLGSWNDLAVFSGLIIIMSLTALMYVPRIKFIKVFTYTNLAMAIFLLAVTNLSVVWIILSLMSLILLVHFLTTVRIITEENNDKDNIKVKKGNIIATVAVLVISTTFVFAGNIIGPKISGILNVQHIDVRPSWDGTMEVARNTYSENAIFGTGPNTFVRQWSKYKPSGVNETAFWNINFSSGVGLVPTAFVTVGIVGGLLWLFFIVSVFYTAFRSLWARMPNDTTKFVVFSTIGGSIYLLVLLIVYVPQSIMLVITLFLTGLFLATARNINAVKTRKIELKKDNITSFVLASGLVASSIIVVFVAVVVIQKAATASIIERAAIAIQQNDLEKAEKLIKKARTLSKLSLIGKDERPSLMMAQLGIISLRSVLSEGENSDAYRERVQQAIENVVVPTRGAIAINPMNTRAHIFLGNVYQQLIQLGIEGAYDASLSAYDVALTLNPNNPSIPIMKAWSAFYADKMEEAQKFVSEALSMKRNYTDAYFLLSQIAIKSGNIKDAIASAESAAILSPNNPGLLFRLGVLQYSAEEYEKAIAVLERAVFLNRNYANALYYLGLSYDKVGNEDGAVAAFTAVSNLNPDNKDIKNIIESLKEGKSTEISEPEAAPSEESKESVSDSQ